MSKRTLRVNELLRDTVSELLLREAKDPRLGQGLVSITEVDVSPDLRKATVYVSHLGTEEERRDALRGLQHAAPYLQRELGRRLDLRATPVLTFRYDPSIERGARLASLINEVEGAGGQAPG